MRRELQNQLRSIRTIAYLPLIGLATLCLLVFSLPFEPEWPSLSLGIYQLTNIELLTLLSILAAIFLVVKERRWEQSGWLKIPFSWLLLLAFFSLAVILSAAFAPQFNLNALKAALRTLNGLALAFSLPQLIPEKRHLKIVIAALLAGGLLSIGLGLVEAALGETISGLNFFRNQPTVAGPFARLSGTFNHANQAAMFIEATIPFLVIVVWKIWQRGYKLTAALGAGFLLLYLQASFLTFSRSSFVTIFLSALIIAAITWLWLPNKRKLAYYWGALAGTVILFIGLNSWLSPILRLRLSTEGDNEWYNVGFIVPEQIEIEAGEILPVSVTVINEGELHWSSQAEKPFNLGGRWYRVADDARSKTEMRWTLERDVAPGESLTMDALLVGPVEPGLYEFEWDMVQEDVIWFSLKNGQRITSQVTVLSTSDADVIEREPEEFIDTRPQERPIPNRRVLWSIAAEQFQDRPLLGIGLDNFRLTYGSVLGWEAWNDSIHTNNWYVEMVVSLGILGSLPFFGWLALLGLDFLKWLRNGRINLWQIALIGGLLAYFIHGLLDYFLMFNGTGLLFWILVGMWTMLAWPEPSG